jgi:Pyruvate/2-oxoacid:ferredoxin oxidoreductase delta subunit
MLRRFFWDFDWEGQLKERWMVACRLCLAFCLDGQILVGDDTFKKAEALFRLLGS